MNQSSQIGEYEEAIEIGRLTNIYLRRLREINTRRALPVGDPERATAEECSAVEDEDFWS
jgi:hypothetical protein